MRKGMGTFGPQNQKKKVLGSEQKGKKKETDYPSEMLTWKTANYWGHVVEEKGVPHQEEDHNPPGKKKRRQHPRWKEKGIN